MLGYLRKKLFVSPKKRIKSRKHVRGAKKGRHKTSLDDKGSTLLSEEYDFSGSEYVPHDIDVAKWVLGVHNPVSKTGYAPIHSISRLSPIRRQTHSQGSPLSSPLTPPPTPVRTSSRMALQRIHNYSHPSHSYPVRLHSSLPQNKTNVRNRINRSNVNTKSVLTTEKSNQTKSKTNKSSAKKNEQNSKHRSDRSLSKSKKSHSKHRSLSRRRQGGERVGWEYQNVTLTRVPGYGFGIAVSGGRDNPHFINGEPSIAISDVLKAGPAEGKLQVNDRVMSANGVSLENVDYNTAVQVLRECGNNVNLLIKRRTLLPNSDLLKVTLTKSNKKDDFGIVLGCRLYIKEITNRSLIDKESSLQEGDLIVKINNTSTENLNLKEAKKLIDNSKEKLNLVINREQNSNNNNNRNNESNINGYTNGQSRWSTANLYDNAIAIKENGFENMNNNNRNNWSNQNVYVQPPTRGDFGHNSDEKNNLLAMHSHGGPSGRNRGPITDISLSQLDQPATPLLTSHSRDPSLPKDGDAPPRPPPPRPTQMDEEHLSHRKHQIGTICEPRFISFQKDGSVGIRLTGGNEVGIFVTAVQPGSPASLQGLQAGDKICKANNKDMRGVTREDAVLFLLSIQEQIDLVVQNRKEEYEEIVANQKGDSFYIRVHFNYDSAGKGELTFHVGEVFHVIDTLFNGVVGSWLVYRLGRNNQEIQKGAVPNRNRAEELAAEYSTEKAKKADTSSESRGSFFKRRSARRSKSLSKDNWEEVVFGDSLSKFAAYERVTQKHPGFIRPIVLFGPLADVAREKLLKDYPEKFGSPQTESNGEDMPKGSKLSGIVRLSAIREIVDKGKHALLDITPSAVDRLNYAQFYPIVIFMRAENKSVVKEMRSRINKSIHKSSRKLYEHGVKLEKLWSHVFTATVTLTSADMWYKKLRETIDKQQQQSIWVAESKPEEVISDDFLFPMTSRLSYASSPESDLDLANDSRLDNEDENSHRLVKASSDPSIATADENPIAMNSFGYPPPYSLRPNNKQLPLHILLRKELSKALTIEAKSKSSSKNPKMSSIAINDADREDYFGKDSSAYNTLKAGERYPPPGPPNESIYGTKTHTGPEPPPRVDRGSKPSRFRSAHERLFGRRERDCQNRESFSAPDYINTTSPTASVPQKCDSLDRPPITNGRHMTGAFGDSSSYSSDSYNKYGSPSSTLDNKQRYNSVTSNGRPAHDPYRFTRSTAQPHHLKQMNPQSPERAVNPMSPPSKYDPIQNRPVPPSPPPKPSNKYHSRMTDGRPVPPPKPNHYPSRPWANEGDLVDSNTNQLPHNLQTNGFGYSPVYSQSKRSTLPNSSNMELPNGPPAYYPPLPLKEQPPNMRAPALPNGEVNNNLYAEQSSFGSPIRKGPYSDTDSSSGYMTSKTNYEMRSPYNSFAKPNSSPVKDNNYMSNGPYLNVPYPPKHSRTSTFQSGAPPPPPPQSLPQPPPSILDLSQNREHRGSAFELYRKPNDSMNRSNLHSFGHHGLPPPPPPLTNNEHNDRLSTSSVDSNHTVIATAKGMFDNNGGTLTSEETGVSVIIPTGAIPPGNQQEIYFKVCKDTKLAPPLDPHKGETLMSPIVMCGPHGLRFETPVELRLPHCASVNPESWSFALKSSDTTNGEPSDWQNVTLDDKDGTKLDKRFVSVLVDHF